MTAAKPDLTSVADELYGLDPADFIGVRDQRVAAARTARRTDLARAVARLRKPTLAAWASNLLVREQPDEADALRRLGEALRTAQAELAGEQLRELNRQRNAVVRKLAGAAADLAAAAGHPLAEAARQEVDATLHAALADADAAREWATGHLAKPLTPAVGFVPGAGPDAAPARRSGSASKASAPQAAAQASASKGSARTAAATRGADARRDELRRRLDKARATATAARERAERLEQDHDAALQRRQQAVDRLSAAQDDVAALTRQLDDARTVEKDARAEETAARRQVRVTTKAAAAARREAHGAQDAVERLDAELGRDPS